MSCAAKAVAPTRSPTTRALWGVFRYGECGDRRGVKPAAHTSSTPHLRLGLQHRNQSARRPELALAEVRRGYFLAGPQLLTWGGSNLNLPGGPGAVPHP